MARKNISDELVCKAYAAYKEQRKNFKKDAPKYPYEFLNEWTGECEKVCYAAMVRAFAHDLIDYGVSLRSGWLTQKGEALIKGL